MMVPPTISTPATMFEKVYIDVMYMQPPAGGYRYIVCVQDDLTGVMEASPLSQMIPTSWCTSSGQRYTADMEP